jgi:hypothetical protein
MEEKEVVIPMETESIRFRPGGMEGKGGGCFERGQTKGIVVSVAVLGAGYLVRKGVMLIREILERKYIIQGISIANKVLKKMGKKSLK